MADLPKVLIIDDEEKILTVARKVLAKENYQVLTSNEVENTLMAIDSQGPISMVLIDNRMPTMQGTELLEKIKAHSPETSRTYDHPYRPSPGWGNREQMGGLSDFLRNRWT